MRSIENAASARSRAAAPRVAARAGSASRSRTARANADRKSTRLNSSHSQISYAVFCLKKKKLLVTSERSPRVFHVITDELARCLAAEEVVTVPGAGHAVHGDNPAYYTAAVLQFLMKN